MVFTMMANIQSKLFWVLLGFLAIGMFYPLIGLVALVCMFAPVAFSFAKGRYWCGNFCPRGSFYDHVASRFSPQKPIPAFFKSTPFRVFALLFVMGMFGSQMYYAWGSAEAMGAVIIRVIFATTIVGIVLSLLFHQRTWCSFCPMGTISAWVSSARKPMPLLVSEACVGCRLCTKACPLQLRPYEAKGAREGFTDPDCLKCGRCVKKCPKQALSFE